MSNRMQKRPLDERDRGIIKFREVDKLTFGKIASLYRISTERANQLYKRAKLQLTD